MKIWVDDVRPAPDGYIWKSSVIDVKHFIEYCEEIYNACMYNLDYKTAKNYKIELIDLDHDAGNYITFGGDYIKILDWLEETNRNYPIRIHSMNPVGRENMRRIIKKNNWKEIK